MTPPDAGRLDPEPDPRSGLPATSGRPATSESAPGPVMKTGPAGEPADPTTEMSDAVFRRRTRRSFLAGGAATVAAVAGWKWLRGQPEDGNIPWALRRTHEFNERLWRTLHRDGALAPTFALAEARMPRVSTGSSA